MKRKYQGVIVLDTKGKEDTVEKMISSVGNEMEAEGARLEQIDHLGKRKFAYPSNKLGDGFYVSYQFEADPGVVEKVRNRLRLNGDVHVQHYQRRSA